MTKTIAHVSPSVSHSQLPVIPSMGVVTFPLPGIQKQGRDEPADLEMQIREAQRSDDSCHTAVINCCGGKMRGREKEEGKKRAKKNKQQQL